MTFSGKKRLAVAAFTVLLAACLAVGLPKGFTGGVRKRQLQTHAESAVIARHRALGRLAGPSVMVDRSAIDRHRALGRLGSVGAKTSSRKDG